MVAWSVGALTWLCLPEVFHWPIGFKTYLKCSIEFRHQDELLTLGDSWHGFLHSGGDTFAIKREIIGR
ncbi:hypothetical protein K0M31_000482 [Melipona bicolor]|uniref:Uncharacterized protein n=1 Tax=Melipona bicolor TaxID=60889 RepID=A0AA40GEY1_9HYME|nr:hypothetical protein K0M31_000482 [Melipona bicolor]